MGTRTRPIQRGDKMTARELEVIGLLAQGCTNSEIAGRLFVSRRTVDSHVQAIFTKSGLSSRTAVAMAFRGDGPDAVDALPVSVATVRISVDLSPELYRKLADYTARLARDTGVNRLPQAEVVRAMIRAADDDLVSGAVTLAVLGARAASRAAS
jgi:DNA-binding CsgD family transcriptional regulator